MGIEFRLLHEAPDRSGIEFRNNLALLPPVADTLGNSESLITNHLSSNGAAKTARLAQTPLPPFTLLNHSS
ncbi:hypothetical protein AHAS_Ahas16G0248900 [Arachis hypogaea]